MLPHEKGVMMKPTLANNRLVLALMAFFAMLKYGLSSSAEAASAVSRRRVPAGVR